MKTRNSCRKSAKWLIMPLLMSGAALCAVGEEEKCPVSANVRGHENIEWSISYAYGLTDETRNLPRVLLIGDSICNGYQQGVRERLKGKMNVTYWISSYCATSPAYLPLLSIYLDEAKYDVIHFNNGLHSLETPTDAWAKGFKAALELVRNKQPDAKIVWCSSTPLANDVKTAKCRELNAAAARVIAELGGIATDDLFALCDPLDRATNWSDEYHFRPEAKAKQADQVAASVSIVPARPAPRPAQAARLAEGPEIYGIVHWGLNTYTDKEWGFGDEDPAMLNPDKFDADQIVGACKAGGLGGLIVVAKHHDGFCLWPTKTTEHNITKTPFGKDYVKEMEQACRRAGLKFGVYVSPWDRNNAHYATEKYVDIYHRQIKELLSGDYGEIFEMWFDGANGGDGWYGGANEKRRIGTGYYRFGEVFGFVRALQPGVCIFAGESDDSDFRWPGNERGVLDADSRATICTVGGYADGKYGNPSYKDQINSGSPDGEFFRMCEADFPLRRGWFYHEKERGTTKSAAYLTKLYLSSVGNGGTMNIGIAPDKSGRLDADDVRALAGFGIMRKALFAHEAKDGEPFNVVVMREDVSNGEQVDEWEFVADGKAILRGKSIGWKRIRVLETPCAARSRELKVLKDGGALKGVSFKLYNADPELVKTTLNATGDDRETDTAKWMTKAAPESNGHRNAARDSWCGFDRRMFEFLGCEAWIVEPKAEAKGRPWAWIMEWPDAFAKRTGSVALLKAGFHVVTLRPGYYENGKFVSRPGNMNNRRLRESRAFQKYLVDELRFAPKANLIGMSWGGFYSVRYAGTYPEVVSRIYLDAPLLDFSTLAEKENWGLSVKYGIDVATYVGKDDPRQPVNMYAPIARARIPILLIYGGADTVVPPNENCLRFADAFKVAGGDIEIVARGLYGHHPHGLDVDEQQKFVDFFSGISSRPAPRPALAARLAVGPEIYGIVHWGLNTYTDREWGFGDEKLVGDSPSLAYASTPLQSHNSTISYFHNFTISQFITVVEIEPIDIDIYFHRLGNPKAGLSPGLAPPQQCLGGWLEIGLQFW